MSTPETIHADWFEDGPDRARILVTAEATAGAWSLTEWLIAPAEITGATDFGPHRHHQCEEIFIVRAGRLDFLLGDEVHVLAAGDTIRVAPGARHGYANLSGAPVELLVAFQPAGLEALFEAHRTDRAGPPPGESFVAAATRLYASEFENA